MPEILSIVVPIRFSPEEQELIDQARGSIARASWVREAGLQTFRRQLPTGYTDLGTPRTLVRQIHVSADIAREMRSAGKLGRFFHDAALARAQEIIAAGQPATAS